jgi:hypothetical protein
VIVKRSGGCGSAIARSADGVRVVEQGLNRLRKEVRFRVQVEKNIPRGLKPTLILSQLRRS